MLSRAKIRNATVKDLSSLVDLETKGFKADNFSSQQFQYLLTRANSTILIMTLNTQAVGAAILLWRRGLKIGRLYNIVIDPAYQGSGLGKRLLLACEKEALKRKCGKLSLEVRADNSTAIGFYRKYGYRITEDLPKYYSGKASGYRMVKTLRAKT